MLACKQHNINMLALHTHQNVLAFTSQISSSKRTAWVVTVFVRLSESIVDVFKPQIQKVIVTVDHNRFVTEKWCSIQFTSILIHICSGRSRN